MARGINRVTLIGNVGADPEVRSTNGGSSVANLNLATTEAWKNKETGAQEEKTEWHRIVFFGKLADIVGQYVQKGRQIYIEGKLQTRKWQGQDGQDRYTTEIVANEMQLLGGGAQQGQQQGQQHQGQPPQQNGGYQQQNAGNNGYNNGPNQGYHQQGNPSPNGYANPGNDVPF